nr:MAG TPA: hypothetical protein [Caudoviricetes sp.]
MLVQILLIANQLILDFHLSIVVLHQYYLVKL